jgi:hypothetical protein
MPMKTGVPADRSSSAGWWRPGSPRTGLRPWGGGGRGPHGQVFVRGVVEAGVSRSQGKHEGESSNALCDRCSRTRDASQRQLPTDQDYAVSTRECQTDQSSHKPALAAAGPVLDKRQKRRQQQKQPHGYAGVDRVTPYQIIFYCSCEEGIVVSHPSRKNCKKQVLRLTALVQDDNGEDGAPRPYTNHENALKSRPDASSTSGCVFPQPVKPPPPSVIFYLQL